MRTNIINESIARDLVGQQFMGGRLISYETRNGKTMMTAECSACGGPHSQISVTNAAQAVKNPTVHLIGCQWPNCKFVPPVAKKETYADAVRVPEAQRSSYQQRLVVEHENAERNTQRAVARQAPAPINRANKAAMWTAWEKYVISLAHSLGQRIITAPVVLSDPAYISWEKWQSGSEDHRANITAQVDAYFESNGLTYEG